LKKEAKQKDDSEKLKQMLDSRRNRYFGAKSASKTPFTVPSPIPMLPTNWKERLSDRKAKDPHGRPHQDTG